MNDEDSKKDKHSFIKQLFFGRFPQSKIFPYPRASLEERERTDLFCHKLRQFSEMHIDPVAIDRQAKISEQVIYGLARLGMLGLNIPQKYGGLEMSLTAFCKALEVIAQRCGSTAAFLIAHQGIGYRAILLFGTPEQKQKWLPSIAKGETIAAFAFTEESAGSDANSIETRAIYDREKNVFYLTGKKQWVTNGSFAKVITVLAKIEMDSLAGKRERVTAFIVTPDLPGFKVIEPSLAKVGLRGIQSSILEFENMEVPVENIIGKVGEGLNIAYSVLNYGRITIGAPCTGRAKILVDNAFKYARDRHQFKQPLANFALVKNKLSLLAALAYAMDAVTYLVAGRVDEGEHDFLAEAAIVKVFSTESLWTMVFETMQIFGGKALFVDQPYELMMRNCRTSMLAEGSNDVMKILIALTGMREVKTSLHAFFEALKKPLRQSESLKKGFVHLWKMFWPAKIEISSSLIEKEAKAVSRETRRLGRKVMHFVMHYGNRGIEKQLDLERLAMAAIGIYTSAAVLSKLDNDLEHAQGKAEQLGRDVETAKLYCSLALRNVRFHLNKLFDPLDKDKENLSDLLIEDL